MSAFELYPAIDLRDGRCVRLYQGDYSQETVYDDDPVRVARAFADAGAKWIHVVDLDAARSGDAANLAVIEAICAAVPANVQSGGGVRTRRGRGRAAPRRREPRRRGHRRHRAPRAGRGAVRAAPWSGRGRARRAWRRDVAVRGWDEGTGADLFETAARFDDAGVAALVVTSIGVDGTLEGPDLEQLRQVLAATVGPGDRERWRRVARRPASSCRASASASARSLGSSRARRSTRAASTSRPLSSRSVSPDRDRRRGAESGAHAGGPGGRDSVTGGG